MVYEQKFLMVILIVYFAKSLFANTLCGDWVAYKEEKCFQLFDKLQSYDDAANTCFESNSTLVTISTLEEQKFIEDYLFKTKDTDENVWTGLKYVDSQYKWVNEFEPTFTNWAEPGPKYSPYLCVQIYSEILLGKWSEVLCSKRNLALCQRDLSITKQKIRKLLENMRTHLENSALKPHSTIKLFEDMNIQLENAIPRLYYKTTNYTKLFLEGNLTQRIVSSLAIDYAEHELKTVINDWVSTKNMLENITSKLTYSVQVLSDNMETSNVEKDKLFLSYGFKLIGDNNTRKALFIPGGREGRAGAIELCGQYNATLVDIETEEKQIVVQRFIIQYYEKNHYNLDNYWIGGYMDSLDKKNKWFNSGNEVTYSHFANRLPNVDHPFYTMINQNGYWEPVSSSSSYMVFCEIAYENLIL